MMSQEVYVKIAGRWEEDLRREFGRKARSGMLKVSPFDLLIDFDVMVRDGSIPGGNFSEAWLQLFDTLTKVPELSQKFNIVRIFKHIARSLGAKNVEEFVRIAPDEEVVREEEKGNVRPMITEGVA